MVKRKQAVEKNKSPKHLLIEDISSLLNTALIKLKEDLGEKKFEKRIKKAVKILIHGIKPALPKKKAVKKKSPTKVKRAATGK